MFHRDGGGGKYDLEISPAAPPFRKGNVETGNTVVDELIDFTELLL